MAEVKCGACILRIAGECRILGSPVAVAADCSLSQTQRKDLLHQTRRIIGTAGGNRAVEIQSIDTCGGVHLHITYSVDGGPSRIHTIDRATVVDELKDRDADEQVVSAIASLLTLVNPSGAAVAVAALEGMEIYIG